ncbi:MAG TPA: hypothetical protein VGN14_15300 [Candidatus Elarobacter sp.]
MQNTTGVAVVATQLAATDRRALSEAWYRALHLAGSPAPRPLAPRVATGARSASPRTPVFANAPHAAGRTTEGTLSRAPRHDGGSAFGPGGVDRRAPRTALATRLERVLQRRAARTPAAQFAVRAAGGRIHLVVRAEHGRTHVVALCAPKLRDRVARALAHARFALAAAGLRCEVA